MARRPRARCLSFCSSVALLRRFSNKTTDLNRVHNIIFVLQPQWSRNTLRKVAMSGVVTFDHASGHQPTLVFRDDNLIRPRTANSVRVTLLSRAGDDFQIRVHGACRHCDVQIVSVVVDHDTNAPCAMNPGSRAAWRLPELPSHCLSVVRDKDHHWSQSERTEFPTA